MLSTEASMTDYRQLPGGHQSRVVMHGLGGLLSSSIGWLDELCGQER